MLRSAARKVMWVGRATVFLVGIAVILALLFGEASMAFARDGEFLLLGERNVAQSLSTLVNQGTGPALSLEVGSGPPMKVNSSKKVAKLNADQLDNKNWRSEAWHEVGATGEPEFRNGGQGDCLWSYFDTVHNSAAFYKDQFGVEHLKGIVKAADGTGGGLACHASTAGEDVTIFQLPVGYWPVKREVHVAISNEQLGRVDVDPDGFRGDVHPQYHNQRQGLALARRHNLRAAN